jgi:sugar-specific transcriptional regulator TrmB
MLTPQDIRARLQSLGLSYKESDILVVLIQLGDASASTLCRKTGIHRSTVYMIINQLQWKGMISSQKKKGCLLYRATDPKIFLKVKRRENLEQNEVIDVLISSLPALGNTYGAVSQSPDASVLRGKAGLIHVLEDSLSAGTPLLSWLNVEDSNYEILGDYLDEYLEERQSLNLGMKAIHSHLSDSACLKKHFIDGLDEYQSMDKKELPLFSQILMYDDKVAMLEYENQIGVIVQNPQIAQSQRRIFEFSYRLAKEYL